MMPMGGQPPPPGLNPSAASFVPSPAVGDVRARLRLVLLHLGEKSQASLESNMSKLAHLLEKDLDKHGEFVVDVIFQWSVFDHLDLSLRLNRNFDESIPTPHQCCHSVPFVTTD